MLNSISPYALLQASRPKPAPTVVTPYDRYSAGQQSAAGQYAAAPARTDDAASPAMTALPPPARRTHYIADIQTRHSAANRRASQHQQPLI